MLNLNNLNLNPKISSRMDEDLDLIIGFLNQKKEKQGGTEEDSLPASAEAVKDGPSPFNTRK